MKPIKKTFAIQSLFEGSDYITVFDDKTGLEAGHIYKESKHFLVHVISTGKKSKCLTLLQAHEVIKQGKGGQEVKDEREIKSFEVWLTKPEQGQRKLLASYSKIQSKEAKNFQLHMARRYQAPDYVIKLEIIYSEEKVNTNQLEIF